MARGAATFLLKASLPTDPRTTRLALRLSDANAGFYVVRLWSFCAVHAKAGRLGSDAETIAILESAMEWRGRKRGALVEALQACGEPGFLELEGKELLVVDWPEVNGSLVRKRGRDARKPRGNRPPRDQRGTSAGPARDGGGTGDGTSAGRETGPARDQRGTAEGRPSAPSPRVAPFSPDPISPTAPLSPTTPAAAAASANAREAPAAPPERPQLAAVPSGEGDDERAVAGEQRSLTGQLFAVLSRGRVTPLVPLQDAPRRELEAKLAIVGVRRALQACRGREETWEGGREAICAERLYAKVVLDLQDDSAAADEVELAIAVRESECELWGALLRRAKDAGMPRPYLAPLLEVSAALETGGALRLMPATPALADVARTHLDSIRSAAAAREGRDVDVFIEPPPTMAEGRA